MRGRVHLNEDDANDALQAGGFVSQPFISRRRGIGNISSVENANDRHLQELRSIADEVDGLVGGSLHSSAHDNIKKISSQEATSFIISQFGEESALGAKILLDSRDESSSMDVLGYQILRNSGWKPGQVIGPRKDIVVTSFDRKSGEDNAGELLERESTVGVRADSMSKIDFPPPKQDTHGIGFVSTRLTKLGSSDTRSKVPVEERRRGFAAQRLFASESELAGMDWDDESDEIAYGIEQSAAQRLAALDTEDQEELNRQRSWESSVRDHYQSSKKRNTLESGVLSGFQKATHAFDTILPTYPPIIPPVGHVPRAPRLKASDIIPTHGGLTLDSLAKVLVRQRQWLEDHPKPIPAIEQETPLAIEETHPNPVPEIPSVFNLLKPADRQRLFELAKSLRNSKSNPEAFLPPLLKSDLNPPPPMPIVNTISQQNLSTADSNPVASSSLHERLQNRFTSSSTAKTVDLLTESSQKGGLMTREQLVLIQKQEAKEREDFLTRQKLSELEFQNSKRSPRVTTTWVPAQLLCKRLGVRGGATVLPERENKKRVTELPVPQSYITKLDTSEISQPEINTVSDIDSQVLDAYHLIPTADTALLTAVFGDDADIETIDDQTSVSTGLQYVAPQKRRVTLGRPNLKDRPTIRPQFLSVYDEEDFDEITGNYTSSRRSLEDELIFMADTAQELENELHLPSVTLHSAPVPAVSSTPTDVIFEGPEVPPGFQNQRYLPKTEEEVLPSVIQLSRKPTDRSRRYRKTSTIEDE